MSKYKVTYRFEGDIEIEADSCEEARDKFYETGLNELSDNLYGMGTPTLDDIRYVGEV